MGERSESAVCGTEAEGGICAACCKRELPARKEIKFIVT